MRTTLTLIFVIKLKLLTHVQLVYKVCHEKHEPILPEAFIFSHRTFYAKKVHYK